MKYLGRMNSHEAETKRLDLVDQHRLCGTILEMGLNGGLEWTGICARDRAGEYYKTDADYRQSKVVGLWLFRLGFFS